MEKKKGFTLIELLAVIVIIAIVSVAAVPAVLTIARNNKNNMFCKKVQTIEKSAQLYGSDEIEEIDEGNPPIDDNIKCNLYVDAKPMQEKEHCQVTTVYNLAERGYVNYEQAGKNKVKNEVIDPRTSSSMLTKQVMVYVVNKRVHAQYIYDNLKDALKCSDIMTAANIKIRELYYMDGSKMRKVNCETNKLEDCQRMTIP